MKISGGFTGGNFSDLTIYCISNNCRRKLKNSSEDKEDLKFDKQFFKCDEKTQIPHFQAPKIKFSNLKTRILIYSRIILIDFLKFLLDTSTI
jgi:hypothetical protein